MPDTLHPPKPTRLSPQAAPQTPAPRPAGPASSTAATKSAEVVSELRGLLRDSLLPWPQPGAETIRQALPGFVQLLSKMVGAGTITETQAFEAVRAVAALAVETQFRDRLWAHFGDYGHASRCDGGFRFCRYERIRSDTQHRSL